MDDIIIKKVWEDSNFFEIEVSAHAENICASTRTYTNDDSIKELAYNLIYFPKNVNEKYIWENGIKGDGTSPFVSFAIFCSDKLGHIIVEVYMEIDDGASYCRHNCCFFVKTEIGLINNFGKCLLNMNSQDAVSLNSYNKNK